MASSHRVSVVVLTGALLASGFRCAPVPRTGNAATFAVRGTLTANTCGPQAVQVDSVVSFSAQLGVSLGSATWQTAGGPSATGTYIDATRLFRFQREDIVLVRGPDRRTGRAACAMRRLDVLEGTLAGPPLPGIGDAGQVSDASADGAGDSSDSSAVHSDGGDGGDAGSADAATSARSFSATETIVYGPTADSDCSDQIGAGDGQFNVLPCTQSYDLFGVAP